MRRPRYPLLAILFVAAMVDMAVAVMFHPRRGSPADLPGWFVELAGVLAYSQVSLAAVWLALGARPVPALWRLMGLWLVIGCWSRLLRLLASVHDWELVCTACATVFLVQAFAIVLPLFVARLSGVELADGPSRLRRQPTGLKSFRFTLATMLFGTAVVAFCLATSTRVINYGLLIELLPWVNSRPLVLSGLAQAAVALFGVWLVLGSRWRRTRLALTGLVVSAGGIVYALPASRQWLLKHDDPRLALWTALVLLVGFGAVRLSGLRLVRVAESRQSGTVRQPF